MLQSYVHKCFCTVSLILGFFFSFFARRLLSTVHEVSFKNFYLRFISLDLKYRNKDKGHHHSLQSHSNIIYFFDQVIDKVFHKIKFQFTQMLIVLTCFNKRYGLPQSTNRFCSLLVSKTLLLFFCLLIHFFCLFVQSVMSWLINQVVLS